MNRSKWLGAALLVAFLAAAMIALGFAWGRGHGAQGKAGEPAESGAPEEGPIAPVKVATLRKGKLEGQISAFGSIVPAPGASQAMTVAYESRVISIAVSEGQVVTQGTILLTVADSPDAFLALEQARIDLKAAEITLQQAKSRHELKLADNAQLAQAEQAFDSAASKVKSLEARHMGATQIIRALQTGVVARLPVQVGAVVPAGTPLAEVADTSRLEARLGVEPQEAARLHPGGTLTLAMMDGKGSASAQARIRTVSPAINPATRLRDAYISLPPGHPFALGQYVNGSLSAASQEGLIVPHEAVLPDEGRYVLFTLRKGHAVRHEVQVLLQGGDQIQVSGEGLDASEPVVIQGNYELQDGMAVRIEQVP